MSESIESVRQEIATTRARLGETIAAIDATVHDTVDSTRAKVDPTRIAPRYPWLALAGAIGAGLAVAMSGADRKAAHGAVQGAKRAGPATVSALKRGKAAASERMHREKGNAEAGYGMAAIAAAEEPGFLGRLLEPARELFDQRAAELLQALWDASREVNPSTPAAHPLIADGSHAATHAAAHATPASAPVALLPAETHATP